MLFMRQIEYIQLDKICHWIIPSKAKHCLYLFSELMEKPESEAPAPAPAPALPGEYKGVTGGFRKNEKSM